MDYQVAIRSEAVKRACQEIWDHRAARRLGPAEELARTLALAVGEDVAMHRRYDPEADQRVLWARAVIRELRLRANRRPQADGDSEAVAAWLLDRMPTPSGRALAFTDA